MRTPQILNMIEINDPQQNVEESEFGNATSNKPTEGYVNIEESTVLPTENMQFTTFEFSFKIIVKRQK